MLFAIYLACCFAAAATGALFMPDDWYRRLDKPRWTPPDWVFPVTWLVLYLLMAFAAARVAGRPEAAVASGLWTLQLAINALWSPVFFGLRRVRSGMVVVVLLWTSVCATMLALWSVDFWAGLAFVPYLVWVSIAAALNLSILIRNGASPDPA